MTRAELQAAIDAASAPYAGQKPIYLVGPETFERLKSLGVTHIIGARVVLSELLPAPDLAESLARGLLEGRR